IIFLKIIVVVLRSRADRSLMPIFYDGGDVVRLNLPVSLPKAFPLPLPRKTDRMTDCRRFKPESLM
ncbi:MAG: hypothetical protein WBL20_04625, partial [Sphingobium sp.]